MRISVLGILAAFILSASVVHAQDPGPPPPAEASGLDWQLRFGALLGGSYFSYEEELSSVVDTEFSTGAFTARFSVEGNFFNLSPFLRFQTGIAVGDESADLMSSVQQENDLSVATFMMDLGLGYRIDLGDFVTLVPAAAYTFDLLSFDREEFEQNGVPVRVLDLDGDPQDSVGESIISNGVSGRLSIEIRPISILDIHLYGIFTYLPDVRVDNEIGGTISTDGYVVRGGVAAYFWILPQIGIGGEVEVLLRVLDKSGVKLRTGNTLSATFQFPDSETVATALTVGFMGRF